VSNDFRVGTWVVRPSLNTVSQNGASTRLEPKVMEVLVCLASQPGEVISKETLVKTVWRDSFVSDDVLIRSISELRRVFEDDVREPRFIETIPKRGYRLVATVTSVHPEPSTVRVSGENNSQSQPGGGKHKFILFAGAAVVLVCGLLVGLNIADARDWLMLRNRPPIRSLAVLPLKNLSDDPAQTHFAYGMAEELITDLSQMSGLRVISHTSVNRYQDTDKPVSQIGRELGVDALIEGAVQRSGNRVRVTAQLIYAAQDKNLWAKTYDGDLRDVLALQSRVAQEIATEIRVNLTPQEAARLSKPHLVDTGALESYWRGRYFLSLLKRDEMVRGREQNAQQEVRDALSNFEQAIQIDPNYAQAYIGYSDAVGEFQGWSDPHTNLALKGKWALMKALELDDTLARAHLALAGDYFSNQWNWAGAEKEYKRAIELDSNSAEAHDQYAFFLDSMGRFQEGLKQHKLQLRLNPDLEIPTSCSPWMPLELRIEQEQSFVDTHSNASIEHYWMLYLLLEKAGRYKEAVDVALKAWQRIGWTDLAQAMQRGYQKAGYHGALAESAKNLEVRAKHDELVTPNVLAHVYGVLGDKDRGIFWLERAYENRDGSIAPMMICLDYEPLRSDPRFAEVVRRVGLTQ